jgi:hypothetical protein
MTSFLAYVSCARAMMNDRRAALAGAAVLVALFFLAAASVYPFLTGLPQAQLVYRAAIPLSGLSAGQRVAVYTLRSDLLAVRSGLATADDEGRLSVARFAGVGGLGGDEQAVLLAADLRTLWLLAGDAEQAELRMAGRTLIGAARGAAESALASPAFEAEYKPALTAIVRSVLAGAWNAEPTQAAFADLLRVADPVLRRTFIDSVRPALVERLRPAVWEVLKANTVNILGVVSELRLDLRPIEQAISGAMTDQRVRDGAAAMVPAVVDAPQLRRMVEVLAGEIVHRLQEDDRLAPLAGKLLADPRFAPQLTALGEPVLALLQALPRTLARLDDRSELNSLASDIVKTQMRGRSGQVLVFMTPDQHRRLLAADPHRPVTLVAETRP